VHNYLGKTLPRRVAQRTQETQEQARSQLAREPLIAEPLLAWKTETSLPAGPVSVRS
jgi:hypothetical protein